MRTLFAPFSPAHREWRRLAFVLVAIPAILVGLLAMHFFTISGAAHSTEARGQSGAIVTSIDGAAEEAQHHHPAGAADCDGACGPEHDMAGMACLLALFFATLMLVAHFILLRWDSPETTARAILARASALQPPGPPSLSVLSISRT